MRLLSLLPGVLLTAVSASSIPRSTTGSLSVAADQPALTFKYSTPDPDPKNWVALYNDNGGGPVNQEYVSPSPSWQYAPESDSSIKLDVSKLEPGNYQAYYLAKDGYKWLADPIPVVLHGSGPVTFLIDEFTTHNARVKDDFEARINGLTDNAPDNNTKFTKVSSSVGSEWVKVSSDGIISGAPTANGNSKVTIQASASDGSTAQLAVTIPVVASRSTLVSTLKVMSFNLWHGGTIVNDYHRKQVAFLSSIDVDVVGVQESSGGHATQIAQALGWYSWQSSDVGIISRYPIAEVYPEVEAGGSVRIALDGEDSQMIMYNAHLGYTPYGPYDFCYSHMTPAQVLKREAQSGRTPQIKEITTKMKAQLANADKIPVFLTGDFNAPSHLDYTPATADMHCGVGSFDWPSSIYPIKAGLTDSYREAHPDPVAVPGITWSPIYLDDEGRPEPLDRIDFVYYKGNLQVVESETHVVGNPTPEPNHQNNEWTSDHRSIMSVFKLNSKRSC